MRHSRNRWNTLCTTWSRPTTDLAHAERCPLPFQSALVDDCIGRGKSVQEGGAIYNFTGPQAFGVADTGDSVYAIQKNVFEDKKITLNELKQALEANFGHPVGVAKSDPACVTGDLTEDLVYEAVRKVLSRSDSMDVSALKSEVYRTLSADAPVAAASSSYDAIHRLLINSPAFGNDIDEVDMVARKCAQVYCREVEKYKNPRGGQFQAGIYPVSANVLFGKDVGALPDGRLAKAPLADGVSPRQGKDVKGPRPPPPIPWPSSITSSPPTERSTTRNSCHRLWPATAACRTSPPWFEAISTTRECTCSSMLWIGRFFSMRNVSRKIQGSGRSGRRLQRTTILAKEVQDDIISRTEQVL